MFPVTVMPLQGLLNQQRVFLLVLASPGASGNMLDRGMCSIYLKLRIRSFLLWAEELVFPSLLRRSHFESPTPHLRLDLERNLSRYGVCLQLAVYPAVDRCSYST